jgi:hypothetical protein
LWPVSGTSAGYVAAGEGRELFGVAVVAGALTETLEVLGPAACPVQPTTTTTIAASAIRAEAAPNLMIDIMPETSTTHRMPVDNWRYAGW